MNNRFFECGFFKEVLWLSVMFVAFILLGVFSVQVMAQQNEAEEITSVELTGRIDSGEKGDYVTTLNDASGVRLPLELVVTTDGYMNNYYIGVTTIASSDASSVTFEGEGEEDSITKRGFKESIIDPLDALNQDNTVATITSTTAYDSFGSYILNTYAHQFNIDRDYTIIVRLLEPTSGGSYVQIDRFDQEFTVDTAAPIVTATPPSGVSSYIDRIFAVSAADRYGSGVDRIEYYNQASACAATLDKNLVWNEVADSGSHTVAANTRTCFRAIDVAGNIGYLSEFSTAFPVVITSIALTSDSDTGIKGDNITSLEAPLHVEVTGNESLNSYYVGLTIVSASSVDSLSFPTNGSNNNVGANEVVVDGTHQVNGVLTTTDENLDRGLSPSKPGEYTIVARLLTSEGNNYVEINRYTHDFTLLDIPTILSVALTSGSDSGIKGDNITNLVAPLHVEVTGGRSLSNYYVGLTSVLTSSLESLTFPTDGSNGNIGANEVVVSGDYPADGITDVTSSRSNQTSNVLTTTDENLDRAFHASGDSGDYTIVARLLTFESDILENDDPDEFDIEINRRYVEINRQTQAFTVDSIAPSITLASPTSVSGGTSYTVSVTDTNGSGVEKLEYLNDVTSCNGVTVGVYAPLTLSNGSVTHTVQTDEMDCFKATDVAGNVRYVSSDGPGVHDIIFINGDSTAAATGNLLNTRNFYVGGVATADSRFRLFARLASSNTWPAIPTTFAGFNFDLRGNFKEGGQSGVTYPVSDSSGFVNASVTVAQDGDYELTSQVDSGRSYFSTIASYFPAFANLAPAAEFTVDTTPPEIVITVGSSSNTYNIAATDANGVASYAQRALASSSCSATATTGFTSFDPSSAFTSTGSSGTCFRVTDNAGNVAYAHTSTSIDTSNDTTPPSVNSGATVGSNNTNTRVAIVGNTITLTFTVSERVTPTPTVAIAGDTAVVSLKAGTVSTYEAVITVDADTNAGVVKYDIGVLTDTAGNTFNPLEVTTAGDSLVTVDNVGPSILSAALTSNNSSDTSLAKVGDILTLTFTASETLASAPSVAIAGQTVTATGTGTSYTATTVVTATTQEGAVTYDINTITDIAGNTSNPSEFTPTGQNEIVVDRTIPRLTVIRIAGSGTGERSVIAFASDAGGVSAFEVADGETTCSSSATGTFTGYTQNTSLTVQANTEDCFRVTDTAGNVRYVGTADATAGVGIHAYANSDSTPAATGNFLKSRTFTVEGVTSASTEYRLFVRTKGGNWPASHDASGTSDTDGSVTESITVSADGTYEIAAQVKDGNIYIPTTLFVVSEFTVDTVAPIVTATPPSGVSFSQNRTFTVTATDINGSGVDKIEHYSGNDSGNSGFVCGETLGNFWIENSTSGSHTVQANKRHCFRAIDVAGNIGYSIPDTVAPAFTHNPVWRRGASVFSGDGVFRLTLAEQRSGLDISDIFIPAVAAGSNVVVAYAKRVSSSASSSATYDTCGETWNYTYNLGDVLTLSEVIGASGRVRICARATNIFTGNVAYSGASSELIVDEVIDITSIALTSDSDSGTKGDNITNLVAPLHVDVTGSKSLDDYYIGLTSVLTSSLESLTFPTDGSNGNIGANEVVVDGDHQVSNVLTTNDENLDQAFHTSGDSGDYTIVARLLITEGNNYVEINRQTQAFTVDSIVPSITLASPTSVSGGTSYTVSVTDTNGSGVEKLEYLNDVTACNDVTAGVYAPLTLSNGSVTHTVQTNEMDCFKATDVAGNVRYVSSDGPGVHNIIFINGDGTAAATGNLLNTRNFYVGGVATADSRFRLFARLASSNTWPAVPTTFAGFNFNLRGDFKEGGQSGVTYPVSNSSGVVSGSVTVAQDGDYELTSQVDSGRSYFSTIASYFPAFANLAPAAEFTVDTTPPEIVITVGSSSNTYNIAATDANGVASYAQRALASSSCSATATTGFTSFDPSSAFTSTGSSGTCFRVTDNAGNVAYAHTSTSIDTSNDTTPPSVNSGATVGSNNTNTRVAIVGNTITLTFTVSERVTPTPTVAIAGDTAVVSLKAGTVSTYEAVITVDADTNAGVVKYDIGVLTDAAGNTFNPLEVTTAGDSLVTVDNVGPSILSAALTSDNSSDTSLAKVGDILTLTFTASETLASAPSVAIAGQTVTATGTGTSYTATTVVTATTQEGAVTYDINTITDIAGNTSNPSEFTPTGQNEIVVDRTIPRLTVIRIAGSGTGERSVIAFASDAGGVSAFEVADGETTCSSSATGTFTGYTQNTSLTVQANTEDCFRVTDTAGNVRYVGTADATAGVGIHAYANSDSTPAATGNFLKSRTFTVEGVTSASTEYRLFVRTKGGNWPASHDASGTSDTDGSVTESITVSADGTYEIAAQVKDGADYAPSNLTAVSEFTVDSVSPTISGVPTFTSNNSDTSVAEEGDILTLTFTVSEALASTPTVTIAEDTVIVSPVSGNTYTATFEVTSSTQTGAVSYDIGVLTDVAGNTTNPAAVTSSITVEAVSRGRGRGGGGGGGVLGIVGAPSLGAFGAVAPPIVTPIPLPTGQSGTEAPTPPLSQGSQGERVRALQQFLNTNGYLISIQGPGSPGQETTYFGPATERALKAYQAANGLPVTGVLDAQTQAYMNPQSRPAGQSGTEVPTSLLPPLSQGSQGERVRALQQFLNTNGYLISTQGPGSPGQETTYFGPATERALKAYQTANGLPVTGVLDAQTQAYMNPQNLQNPQAAAQIAELKRLLASILIRIGELLAQRT